jgi:hypothetical protein
MEEQGMNANDARLTQLFVAVTGSQTQDDSPNETGGVPGDFFDLLLRGEAGEVIGGSNGDYNLSITAFNVSKGVAEPLLNPITNPQLEEFKNAAPGNWAPFGDDFIKQETYNITIDPAVPRGDVYQYTAQLVTVNFEVIVIIQSALFILA